MNQDANKVRRVAEQGLIGDAYCRSLDTCRPFPQDNDEQLGWRSVSSSGATSTLVNERSVQILQDAEGRLVAKVSAGTDEVSVLSRMLSHTHCTL